MEEASGLHNFLEIVTKPDNIPIVAMLILVIFFTWLGTARSFQERQADGRRKRRRNSQRNVEIVDGKGLADCVGRPHRVWFIFRYRYSSSFTKRPTVGIKRAKIWRKAKPRKRKLPSSRLLKEYPERGRSASLSWACRFCACAIRTRPWCRIKRAIGIDPNHVEARTLLGYVELEVRGDVDAAIKEYTKVIELRPDLPEAYSNLAVAQKKKGDLNQAIASLNKALERKPEVRRRRSPRAAAFSPSRTNGPKRGAISKRRSSSIRADDGALYGLAESRREARDYAGAQQALSELISRSPNFVYWLEWGRIGLIRYWWVLLTIAMALGSQGTI